MNRYIWLSVFFIVAICNAKSKNFIDKINVPVYFPFSYSVLEQADDFLVSISTKKISKFSEKSECLKSVNIKNGSELQLAIKKSCFVNFIPVISDTQKFSLDIIFYLDKKEMLNDKKEFLTKAYENKLRINLSNRSYIDPWEKFDSEKKSNPSKKGDFVIVLDPGHGGFDPGYPR